LIKGNEISSWRGIRVIRVRVNRVKMTEKWGQIQGKWALVRVSWGVRVIRVRVTGVLLYDATHTHTQHTQKLGLKEFCEKVSVRAILNI